MQCNIDMVENIITNWAKNLYMLNNMASGKSAQELYEEFNNKFYGDDARGLNRLQQTSEKGFTLLCIGLSYIPGQKLSNIISKNALVDEWRRTVLRNRYQQRYDFFIQCMEEARKKFDLDTVARECPSKESAYALLSAFGEMKYKGSESSQALLNCVLRYIADNEGLTPKVLKLG